MSINSLGLILSPGRLQTSSKKDKSGLNFVSQAQERLQMDREEQRQTRSGRRKCRDFKGLKEATVDNFLLKKIKRKLEAKHSLGSLFNFDM